LQAAPTFKALILAANALLLAHCRQTAAPESAAAAIARSRGSLVDQVNAAGDGAPFFTVQTLNPIWADDSATPIVRIPAIALTDQEGQERTASLFHGKVTVVGFMFTSCNGFCPMLVQKMQQIAGALKGRADLQYVAISVDPENDTPARLREYAAAHRLDTAGGRGPWVLLTGSAETVYSLARNTFASQVFQRPGAGPRDFVHAGHLYVIDAQGRLRGILNGTAVNVSSAAMKVVASL
jgi:protein SCO1/2